MHRRWHKFDKMSFKCLKIVRKKTTLLIRPIFPPLASVGSFPPQLIHLGAPPIPPGLEASPLSLYAASPSMSVLGRDFSLGFPISFPTVHK